jgi:hypothetical protein
VAKVPASALAGLHVVLGQALQPGFLVRGKHRKRSPSLGQHFVAVKHRLVLERLEGDTAGVQGSAYRGIAALGLRLVIAIGKNRGDAELASQPGDLLGSPAMAYQQAAAAPAQSGVELKQAIHE